MNDTKSTILRSAQSLQHYRGNKAKSRKVSPVIPDMADHVAEWVRKNGNIKTLPILSRANKSFVYKNLAARVKAEAEAKENG